MPELDPDVSDEAPISDHLTEYDREHLVTYLRMLDADAADAEPEEVMRRQHPVKTAGTATPPA